MNNNNYLLEKFEAISLILIIMVNKLILNVPYYFVSTVGSGSIINLIYIGIIDFIFLLLIIKLLDNFGNADIIDISEFLCGKIFKGFIGIVFCSFFIIVAFITLSDFANMVQVIYLGGFKKVYIVLFFILSALIANLIGFKSIIRTICLIVPFTIISIIISFLGSYEGLKIEHFSPFFGHNFYTTFISGSINIFSMYIISYFYFLKPLLKDHIDFKKIAITSYAISWILLFITVVSILAFLGARNPTEGINFLYLLSRNIELGNFFQRADALFILLWTLSIFCYLSICIFFVNRILKKIFYISNEKMLSFPISCILFGTALIPLNVAQIRFFENTLYKFMIIILVFGVCLLILLMANLKLKLKKGKT